MTDPDEHLRDLLLISRAAVATSEHRGQLRMADLVLELHDHLQKGGRLPTAWAVSRETSVMSEIPALTMSTEKDDQRPRVDGDKCLHPMGTNVVEVQNGRRYDPPLRVALYCPLDRGHEGDHVPDL